MSDALLNRLDPAGQPAAKWLLAFARSQGIPVVVTSGFRTAAQQAALTPAAGLYKAAKSRHTEGRAFDLGISGYQWHQVPPEYFRWLGSIWKALGGRWGGDFSRPDPIHFDF